MEIVNKKNNHDFTKKSRGLRGLFGFIRIKFAPFCLPQTFDRKTQPWMTQITQIKKSAEICG